MYAWLPDALADESVVLTASRRLARQLLREVAAQEVAAGRQAWQTPRIFAFEDWCRDQLEQCADRSDPPVPIDGFASGILWERCLQEQGGVELPALRGVVRQAREAWRRLNEWNVPLAAVRQAARSADERLFADAAGAYQRRLLEAGWVDAEGVPAWVAAALRSGELPPPKLTLAGFDRLVPQVDAVRQAVLVRGSAVAIAPEAPAAARLELAACADADAEMRTAGAWARATLQRDPGANIAIVNPELQAGAERLARLVREGLAPGWQYGGARLANSVNVSYGRRLSDYPAVAAALLALRWIHQGLSLADVSLLLRSRCIAGGEVASRSRLELVLRRLPDQAWAPGSLKGAMGRPEDSPELRHFLQGLDACATCELEAERRDSPAHWASRIDGYLAEWQWPGPQAQDSDTFQLVNRWRDLLNELAATTRVTPAISFREALLRVAARAGEIVFQPENEGGAVTLLGTLEAAGMRFDHVWVSGLHTGQWPPAGSPSALLSRQLQKDYGMPDATPADTLAFARRVLKRLAASGTEAVFSWPRHDGESELAASSLLDDLACAGYDGPGDPGWHAGSFCAPEPTAPVAADPVPAVASDETVKGGAYTVQRQAVEPFRAFVCGRLGVSEPQAIEPGISAQTRGNLIHAALQALFADHPTQQQVRQWDAAETARRLGSAIDSVMTRHLRHADATLARLLGLERTRLYRLLQGFLATELARPEYAIVDVERKIDYVAHGVRLELRVDRIDRLADGSLLVIDYKTGAPRNLLKQDGDPHDLQLVVYADALDTDIGGLLLINLDSSAISYKGTGGSVEWDAKRRDSWPERLAAWRAAVHRALQELAAGDARINLQTSIADARPLAILSRAQEFRHAE